MGNTYQQRRRPARAQRPEAPTTKQESARPAAAQLGALSSGHRVDLPDRMREKMENAFGTDFSAVKLYESESVGEAGAKAVTQGTNIIFAPGMLNFSSYGGQSLLGHELSHVVSQSRGEARGSGLLENAALEARADREGAMAAAGQAVAMPSAALSSVTAAPAAGPMQAKKKQQPEDAEGVELADLSDENGELPETEPAPAKIASVKSNGAFETMLQGLAGSKESVAKVTDPLSDLDALRGTIGEKLGSVREKEQMAGKFLNSDKLKGGALSSMAEAKAGKAVDKLKSKGVDKLAKKAGAASTLVSNAAAVPLSVMKLGGAYEKMDKAEEYGTKQDAVNAKFDAANAGLGAAKKGTTFAGSVAKQLGSKQGAAITKTMGTGIGLAGQGMNLLKDVSNVRESSKRKESMEDSARAMQKAAAGGQLSEDDQEKLAIFRQGHGQAGLDQKQAVLNTASDTLGFGSSLANTFGGAPVGAALDTMKKVVDTVGGEVMSYETDKFQGDTVEDKLHMKEKTQDFRNEDRLRAFNVSDEDYSAALLRKEGYESSSVEEAFEGITGDRADKLMDAAEKGEDWAREYAGNAGIDADKIGKSDDHRKAARASFLKSLGGSGDKEFHSSNVLKYNAFQGAADEKKAADEAKANDKRTFKEKAHDFKESAKEKVKDAAASSWESVKTGAGKAATAVKRTASGAKDLAKRGWEGTKNLAKRGWAGAKSLAKSGWEGAKELATSKEARQNAWQSMKTGAANAVSRVGQGAKNLAKSGWEGAKKAASSVKDFATNADTRKAAWDSVKTGAGKAAGTVKRGAKYAFDVGKHAVTSRVGKLKNWYQEGVDQMNVHGDTYKQMGLLDRAKWTAKNLPARLLHGTQKNQEATVKRFNKALTADEAVAHMKDFQEKKKKQEA